MFDFFFQPHHSGLGNQAWCIEQLSHALEENSKRTRCLSILGVSTIIFSNSIRSHNLYLLSALFLYFSLKNFKGTQCFILVMKQADIHVSWVIIYEGDEVFRTIRIYVWTKNIWMYDILYVCAPLDTILRLVGLLSLNVVHTSVKISKS